MFNASTLLLDDALKPVTPLTNGTINQMLQQFTPLDDCLLQLVDCHEMSVLISHLLKAPQTAKSTRFKFGLCLETTG